MKTKYKLFLIFKTKILYLKGPGAINTFYKMFLPLFSMLLKLAKILPSLT